MIVTITGIKSKKTLNKIEKALDWTDPRITGSVGNYQVKVDAGVVDPVTAFEFIYRAITNLTDDHKANLKWKVSK